MLLPVRGPDESARPANITGTWAIIGAPVPGDPILARQLEAMAFMLVGMALVGLALYLRLRVFIGHRPGGVDTWYYLASAEALRSQKRIPISTAAVPAPRRTRVRTRPSFRSFWRCLPRDWLRSQPLAAVAADRRRPPAAAVPAGVPADRQRPGGGHGRLIYAVTPQLISETRNLNGRAFASLLQTLAMLALLRSAIPSDGPTSVLLGAERRRAHRSWRPCSDRAALQHPHQHDDRLSGQRGRR